MDLKNLGWNDHFATALSCLGNPRWFPPVVSGDRNALVVVTAEGEQRATISGRMLHLARDSQSFPESGTGWPCPRTGRVQGVIRHVLPRRTRLGRRVPGRATREQVLAANVDTAFIVQAMDSTFNPRRMERFLAMTHDGGVRPVILLNKADLRGPGGIPATDPGGLRGHARRGLQRTDGGPGPDPGFHSTRGNGSLRRIFRRRKIEPGELPLRGTNPGDDRGAGGRFQGRHTTSSRELIPLDCGGLVIDTPGLRELQVWLEEEGLDVVFAEIRELAASCRFRDCSHTDEPDYCRTEGNRNRATPTKPLRSLSQAPEGTEAVGRRPTTTRPGNGPPGGLQPAPD